MSGHIYKDITLSPALQSLIGRISAENLTYLSREKLINISLSCFHAESNNIEGAFIEAGCALGGATILLASLKKRHRQMFVYDVFSMIPPPSSEDPERVHMRYETIKAGKSEGIGGDTYYGYIDDLYNVVLDNMSRYGISQEKNNVSLIQGLVQETLHLEQAVAFAHIDVDWYDPVKVCLDRIFPCLSVGGSMIVDDYFDWGGCTKATDEFIKKHYKEIHTDDSFNALKITRIE